MSVAPLAIYDSLSFDELLAAKPKERLHTWAEALLKLLPDTEVMVDQVCSEPESDYPCVTIWSPASDGWHEFSRDVVRVSAADVLDRAQDMGAAIHIIGFDDRLAVRLSAGQLLTFEQTGVFPALYGKKTFVENPAMPASPDEGRARVVLGRREAEIYTPREVLGERAAFHLHESIRATGRDPRAVIVRFLDDRSFHFILRVWQEDFTDIDYESRTTALLSFYLPAHVKPFFAKRKDEKVLDEYMGPVQHADSEYCYPTFRIVGSAITWSPFRAPAPVSGPYETFSIEQLLAVDFEERDGTWDDAFLAALPSAALLVDPDLYERDDGQLAVALYSRDVKMSAELQEAVFELPFAEAMRWALAAGAGIGINPHLADWTFKYGELLCYKLHGEFYLQRHESQDASEHSTGRPYECSPLFQWVGAGTVGSIGDVLQAFGLPPKASVLKEVSSGNLYVVIDKASDDFATKEASSDLANKLLFYLPKYLYVAFFSRAFLDEAVFFFSCEGSMPESSIVNDDDAANKS